MAFERESVLNIDQINKNDFGPLLRFVENDDITDINWNGNALWIDDVNMGRYKTEDILEAEFIDEFARKMSNVVNKQFNSYDPKLEAETDDLRVTVLHNSISNTGTVISIRKIPAVNRIHKDEMVENGYCSKEIVELEAALVKAKMNIVVSGLPGAGKTEHIKYLAGYIKDTDRIVTIEDTLEMHLAQLYPEKDVVELKVKPEFSYIDAIKCSLRLLPNWISISEIRREETAYYMEALSCGTHGITSLHSDGADKIPYRIETMTAGKVRLDDVFRFVDVGIHLRRTTNQDGSFYRYIEQMCFFNRDEKTNTNQIIPIIKDRCVINNNIPEFALEKFKAHGITVPKLRREETY